MRPAHELARVDRHLDTSGLKISARRAVACICLSDFLPWATGVLTVMAEAMHWVRRFTVAAPVAAVMVVAAATVAAATVLVVAAVHAPVTTSVAAVAALAAGVSIMVMS